MLPLWLLGSLDTRRNPAIARGASGVAGVEELAEGAEGEAGLSASLSRLLLAGGLALGRGRSPTDASSYKISLQVIN